MVWWDIAGPPASIAALAASSTSLLKRFCDCLAVCVCVDPVVLSAICPLLRLGLSLAAALIVLVVGFRCCTACCGSGWPCFVFPAAFPQLFLQFAERACCSATDLLALLGAGSLRLALESLRPLWTEGRQRGPIEAGLWTRSFPTSLDPEPRVYPVLGSVPLVFFTVPTFV